jgi:hypothetical protein
VKSDKGKSASLEEAELPDLVVIEDWFQFITGCDETTFAKSKDDNFQQDDDGNYWEEEGGREEGGRRGYLTFLKEICTSRIASPEERPKQVN